MMHDEHLVEMSAVIEISGGIESYGREDVHTYSHVCAQYLAVLWHFGRT